MKQETNPIYAVWKYDQYPYLLCGKIIPKDGNLIHGAAGHVYVEGYDGMAFSPVKIMPEKQGIDLIASLRSLKADRDKKIRAVQNDFFDLLNKVRKSWDLPIL